MKRSDGLITRISLFMDRVARICLVAVMALVVVNVLSRVIFHRPILGTYELVGYLTALSIAFALAYCAVQKGHIAVEILVNRFPERMQAVVEMITTFIALVFWGVAAWQVAVYARSMTISGLVSATAEIPVYPIVYLIALGILGLCLVLLLHFVNAVKKAVVK